MKASRRKAGGLNQEDNPAREPVDREKLIQVALDLLDEDGLDKLSMRRLAERLGIKAASLYWHLHDKADLLALLSDELCAGMQAPDPSLPWREQLEAMMREVRRVLLSHRDAALVMIITPPNGPNRIRLIELVCSILLKAGFDPEETINAGFLLNDYCTNFAAEENRIANAATELNMSSEQLAKDTANLFQSLPPDKYPAILAVAPHVSATSNEDRFSFGLNVLLDGLEDHLKAHKKA
ncbi:MAG TPA: TetR/AcrR family transcriptional regulator [Chloroflexia bacterium]|nr:TetR/AcrR family transcriptional regulator [Chloroflexia bacterium]